jgi:hypothetical protein
MDGWRRALGWNIKKYKKALLANRLLGFLMTGLSTSYKIPVAFFLLEN